MRPAARRTAVVAGLLAAASAPPASAQTFRQTQTDDYTRYELLEPGTHTFRIYYDVSATAAGARHYFNGLRAGSEHIIHGAQDLASGAALPWKVVSGEEARAAGMTNASPNGEYLQVTLVRAVPAGGQQRIRIDKSYRDTASYVASADRIVFDRSLGIDRNAVVLPPGYELTAVNFPSQVAEEEDGRIRVSFMNAGPDAVGYRVEARRLPDGRTRAGRGATTRTGASAAATPAVPDEPPPVLSGPPARSRARLFDPLGERAFENRDITYFLQQPETHTFRLFHDYTETRPGVDRYLNVVRAGSKASDPEAVNLDTGEPLRVETLRGAAIRARGLDIGDVGPETEVIAIWFEPVPAGGSTRLRITETYTDPGRYLLDGDHLVWDRSFGRARNTVVLPDGWHLTESAIPATVSTLDDGRVQLRFINDRPGDIDVFLRARRR
jgi:hypothetical protein